jgi:RNA polymerase sigma-70 factor (TIGR02960 family)
MTHLDPNTTPPDQVMLAAVTAAAEPFRDLAGAHRRALHVHCYRMVGSFSDAEDLVQETLLRAWRARDAYDLSTGEIGRRRWLYRIATNVCLDFLKSAARRVSSMSRSFAEVPWLQPYPDALLDELPSEASTPDAAAAAKETIALGYLALIQLLPPQQRAVLLLRDVLDWSAAETADLLGITVTAANSSLQRARDTVAKNAGAPTTAPTEDERAVLAAFIDAHQRADAAAAIAMLSVNARVTMPPLPQIFVGVDAIAPLLENAFGTMGEWRLVPAWANRQPGAISYLRRPGDTRFRVFKIDVLHVRDGRIAEITTFNTDLVAAFGAAAVLPEDAS